MAKFLTMKEAARFVGKSPSSVRRILYPILEDNRHSDRHHVEPDVATAKSLRLKGENFAWKISEELLRREFPEGKRKSGSEAKSQTSSGNNQSDIIIELLREQLAIMKNQIATQTDLIKGLSERLREGNILMGSLQRQLAPPAPINRNNNNVVDANAPSPKPERGSDVTNDTPKKTPWYQWKIF